jgi:hypothetical protein
MIFLMAIGIQVEQLVYMVMYRILLFAADANSIDRTSSTIPADKIRQQIDILHEENNMLKLKVEVLLNLVAESIAELSSSNN